MAAAASRDRVRRDRPHPPAPSPAAAGEGEQLSRGRAKPSPAPPDCRGAAASQPLPKGYLPLSAPPLPGEAEKQARGRAKPSPAPPDCRGAAASRWRPPPVRRRERGRNRLGRGPSPSPAPGCRGAVASRRVSRPFGRCRAKGSCCSSGANLSTPGCRRVTGTRGKSPLVGCIVLRRRVAGGLVPPCRAERRSRRLPGLPMSGSGLRGDGLGHTRVRRGRPARRRRLSRVGLRLPADGFIDRSESGRDADLVRHS